MKITIFGLGYVGVVSAGCLANEGNIVLGVDPNGTKVDMINAGNSPIVEGGLDELIQSGVDSNRLSAVREPYEAIMSTELTIICVGTPSQLNGNLDLKHIRHVCEEIGKALKDKHDFHVIVCRSTMLPGSMRNVVIPTLEEFSGKRAEVNFGVCNNPEFLREGTALYDYNNPPKTVIGETDSRSGDMLASLYEHLEAPLIRTSVETAEMVKYTDNNWHALKVCFANEIGNLCKRLNIDSHRVMEIFCQDTKLNLSSYYMKPGFAFGGSCLPKDVRALTYKGRDLDLDLPVLNAILPSNQRQIEYGIQVITSKGHKKIGVLGFSFKAGTDDLRESPVVEVIERLLGKGYDLKIYDRNVNIAKLVGANRDYILNHIPHVAKLMEDDLDSVLAHGQTLVIGNKSDEFADIMNRITPEQVVVDLVRICDHQSNGHNYEGICW